MQNYQYVSIYITTRMTTSINSESLENRKIWKTENLKKKEQTENENGLTYICNYRVTSLLKKPNKLLITRGNELDLLCMIFS